MDEGGGRADRHGCNVYVAVITHTRTHTHTHTHTQVIDRARCSTKVPPSLVVMSRVRKFDLPRGPEGGFGITLRGDCPVFIRSVDFHSPARAAGVKSGDLLLEVNGDSIRYSKSPSSTMLANEEILSITSFQVLVMES